MAMPPSPDYVRDGRPRLDDHPAVRVRVERPQGPQDAPEILCDGHDLAVEQRQVFTRLVLFAVQTARSADLIGNLLVDLCLVHGRFSEAAPILSLPHTNRGARWSTIVSPICSDAV